MAIAANRLVLSWSPPVSTSFHHLGAGRVPGLGPTAGVKWPAPLPLFPDGACAVAPWPTSGSICIPEHGTWRFAPLSVEPATLTAPPAAQVRRELPCPPISFLTPPAEVPAQHPPRRDLGPCAAGDMSLLSCFRRESRSGGRTLAADSGQQFTSWSCSPRPPEDSAADQSGSPATPRRCCSAECTIVL